MNVLYMSVFIYTCKFHEKGGKSKGSVDVKSCFQDRFELLFSPIKNH